jgi:cytochrome b561
MKLHIHCCVAAAADKHCDSLDLHCAVGAVVVVVPELRLSWLFVELQLKLTEELGEWCAAAFALYCSLIAVAALFPSSGWAGCLTSCS